MGILLKDAFESFYVQPLLTGIMSSYRRDSFYTITPDSRPENERTMTAKDAL